MRKRGLLKNFTGSLLCYKVISQSFFSEICIIELFKNFLLNLKLFFPQDTHILSMLPSMMIIVEIQKIQNTRSRKNDED